MRHQDFECVTDPMVQTHFREQIEANTGEIHDQSPQLV